VTLSTTPRAVHKNKHQHTRPHYSRLTLVDLAGSERVDKSGVSGKELKEAQSINKSLAALSDVVGARASGASHVPYRNHPLTTVMADCLLGRSKTLMLVCCSPEHTDVPETLSALSFGQRCKGKGFASQGGVKDSDAKVTPRGGAPSAEINAGLSRAWILGGVSTAASIHGKVVPDLPSAAACCHVPPT